jgi:hypothetical protein
MTQENWNLLFSLFNRINFTGAELEAVGRLKLALIKECQKSIKETGEFPKEIK